jgi:hypothetical protein
MVSHDNWDVMIPFFSPWKIDFLIHVLTMWGYNGISCHIIYHVPCYIMLRWFFVTSFRMAGICGEKPTFYKKCGKAVYNRAVRPRDGSLGDDGYTSTSTDHPAIDNSPGHLGISMDLTSSTHPLGMGSAAMGGASFRP